MPGDSKESTHNFGHPSHGQNAAGNTAGEFTQIFAGGGGASYPASPQAQPGTPDVAEDEFSRLFRTAPLPAAPVPSPSTAANEATLMFEALPPMAPQAFKEPVVTAAPQAGLRTGPSDTAPQEASSAGEFTQIFSALAPPAAAAAPVTAQATLPPASAGEFTQFFSAVSARESPPNSHQSAVARSPLQPVNPAPSETASSAASAVTQVFLQEATPAQTSRARVSEPPVAPAAVQGESFTQIFQQIAPPPQSGRMHSAPPDVFPYQLPTPTPPIAAHGEWPAFGPPPPPSGSFTDVFAAQPQPLSAPPNASPGGAFTELFPASSASSPRAGAMPYATPSVSGGGWPSASQESPLNPAGGDFTRLMQSLTPGAQQAAQPLGTDEAFFAPVQAAGRSQESEFTRIQQASSRREAGAKAQPVAQAEPSLAAPKEVAGEKPASAKKSKLLIILLVAMNVLLLLALIVIAYITLRHK